MEIEQVDVVRVESAQASFDACSEPLCREWAVVTGIGMRHSRFGGQSDGIASAVEQLCQHALGLAARIAVGRVDVRDTGA